MLKQTLMIAAGATAMTLMPVVNAMASDVENPWMVRLRGLYVTPDESGTTSINGDVEIDAGVVPELDISYFLTENFALELILAVTPHDVAVAGSAVGDIDLGDVWPYIGAGINYTVFFGEDEGPTADAIDYSNEFGFALQGGVDIPINDTWVFNADVKKLWLGTDVEVQALGTTVTADVDIDPWIVGVGFGRRF